MYIKEIIQTLFIVLFFHGCHQPYDGLYYKYYEKYLDGNIRSFDIIDDMLYVASEDEGIFIYQINKNEDNRIILDSLFWTDEVQIPVTLEIAKQSKSLIVLDDYNHTYIGKTYFFVEDSAAFLTGITCDDYQRKSTFIDHSDKPVELITPFRHKPTQNEVDTLAWDTSSLHRITFSEAAYDYNVYSGDCSDILYQYLNYEIEDIYYNNVLQMK